jgi:predicted dehydrogenase
MSKKIPLAIVGCGGMGHRHMYGLAELQESGLSPFELVGACDPNIDNANSLADQAEERFGKRPQPVASLEELAKLGDVQAVDICTLPAHHHSVAVEAMERGWHVLCEKPVGLTARACKLMREAAARTGCILSVAENYRRDPVNRLAKALLDAGVIGAPRLMIHNTIGGGNRMMITVWRHQKNASGLLLDVGVHFADIMEFFLGDAVSIYAQTRLHEKTRLNPMAGRAATGQIHPSPIYERWQREMPAEFEATAEDACYATILFKNGAVAQYTEDHAARGEGMWKRAIYGSLGSMDLPGDRSGKRLTLHREGQESIDDARLLELVPDFHLDEVTAKLFGGERLFEYDLEFPLTDRKLLAVEYWELGQCIEKGLKPEVDIEQGARSVALSYAWMESQQAGRAVTLDEVFEDRLNSYQAEINESMGI